MNLEKIITMAGVCAGVFTAVGAVAQVKKGIDALSEIEHQEQEQKRLAVAEQNVVDEQ